MMLDAQSVSVCYVMVPDPPSGVLVEATLLYSVSILFLLLVNVKLF